jgi:hypothetical protein
VDLNPAAMAIDDFAHDRQAQSAAFPGCLGGEKGFEDLVLNRFRNAATVVSDGNFDFIAMVPDRNALWIRLVQT